MSCLTARYRNTMDPSTLCHLDMARAVTTDDIKDEDKKTNQICFTLSPMLTEKDNSITPILNPSKDCRQIL